MPPASNSVIPAGGGFVQVKPEAFPSDFAADVPRHVAQFMAISQVPISAEHLRRQGHRRGLVE